LEDEVVERGIAGVGHDSKAHLGEVLASERRPPGRRPTWHPDLVDRVAANDSRPESA
jgi:hypothetical protein